MRVRRTLDLPQSQEEVFDFLADLRNELLWHPDAEQVSLETGEPVGPGSTFRVHYHRLGDVEIELVTYERPWRLVFGASGATKAVYETRLEAREGGTHLVTIADAHPRGPGRLLLPLLRRRIQKDFQRRGELLARGLAERAQQPEPRT